MRSRTLSARLLTPLSLAVLLASGAAAPLAQASPAAPEAATQLVFDKNKSDQTSSRLLVKKGNRTLASYRAGSGYSTNACARQQGWLPNGNYSVLGHERHKNSIIKGYAIHISNHKCKNGTLRSGLFIHSEMTPGGGQGGSESSRWDGVQDYKSLGCIKLRPADIKALFTLLDRNGWPGSLKVHG